MSDPRRPAVFFDRDGVINADLGYVGHASRFVLLPEAAAAVRTVNRSGALAFLVTNQSGVARGFFTEADVAALHRHMEIELGRGGARFDGIRHCPHLPDAAVPAYRLDCACRKPKPGMILDLMARWRVDPARSALIGDRDTDMAAAAAAGIRGLLHDGGSLTALVAEALRLAG